MEHVQAERARLTLPGAGRYVTSCMVALRQFLDILLKPDNIPDRGHAGAGALLHLGRAQAGAAQRQLIEQGREDEILKEMQRSVDPPCPSRSSPRTAPGCTACEKRCPTRAISGDPKKAFFIEPSALHRLRRLRRDLPRRGDPRHLRQRHQGAEAAGAARSPSSIRTTATAAASASTSARSTASTPSPENGADYLGRVEVNEKTCVGCKLCEEVCGWEGIYIMPGREKEPSCRRSATTPTTAAA